MCSPKSDETNTGLIMSNEKMIDGCPFESNLTAINKDQFSCYDSKWKSGVGFRSINNEKVNKLKLTIEEENLSCNDQLNKDIRKKLCCNNKREDDVSVCPNSTPNNSIPEKRELNITPEGNIRNKANPLDRSKIISRNLSYQKATDNCANSPAERSPTNSGFNVDDKVEGLLSQNSVISQNEKKPILPVRKKTSNCLEKSKEELSRSSSFTCSMNQISKICDSRRSFPLQKGNQSSLKVSSTVETSSENIPLSSIPTVPAMVPSLDASSQTSHKKGLMNSIVRQLSFKSGKNNKPKRPSDLTDLNGQPELVAYSSLIRLFECPGCLTLMNPPFYQCRKGHIICEKCKVTLKYICPECRQRITEETNVMMEKVCHLLTFPCRFNKFGCTEYHPPTDKQSHESFCQYRPVQCHFSAQGCQKVLTLRDMKVHVAECNFKEFASD